MLKGYIWYGVNKNKTGGPLFSQCSILLSCFWATQTAYQDKYNPSTNSLLLDSWTAIGNQLITTLPYWPEYGYTTQSPTTPKLTPILCLSRRNITCPGKKKLPRCIIIVVIVISTPWQNCHGSQKLPSLWLVTAPEQRLDLHELVLLGSGSSPCSKPRETASSTF